MEPDQLWHFLPLGYALTVAIELPVLWLALSPGHSWSTRLFASFWLTACTYPIVVLALPPLLVPTYGWWTYFAIAETFAVVAECLLFRLAVDKPDGGSATRDMLAVAGANVCSMSVGLIVFSW